MNKFNIDQYYSATQLLKQLDYFKLLDLNINGTPTIVLENVAKQIASLFIAMLLLKPGVLLRIV